MANRSRMARKVLNAYLRAGAVALVSWPVAAQSQPDMPRAQVSWPGGNGVAGLDIDGDTAILYLWAPDGKVSKLRVIDTVDDALAILADQRLAFAWPALLTWAGDDLHILRDRVVDRAERAANRQVAPLPVLGREKLEGSNPHFFALKQYIEALEEAGRNSAAIAKTAVEISHSKLRDDPYATAQLEIMQSGLLFAAGETVKAWTLLIQASTDARSGGGRSNININAALLLARVGKYDWALKINDQTQRDQRGWLWRLPDSKAYFAAIRACALNGLGRTAEARAALATIGSDPGGASHLSVKAESRLLALSCMHDAAGLASELASQIQAAPPAADILLTLQPARATLPAEHATLVAALATDVAAKAMAGRVRVLDGSLSSAVSEWRDASVH